MGKTSITSVLNFPGRLGWVSMEVPGFTSMLYTAHTLAKQTGTSPSGLLGLPWQNQLMAAMFTLHYLNRAIIAPLFLNPSMSPIHAMPWSAAVFFQLSNGIATGAWIGGYGRVTERAWRGRETQVVVGAALWLLGLLGNWWHDEELRRIRRDEVKKRKAEAERRSEGKDVSVGKVYVMPERGLFGHVLYAHYLCEWGEWIGFWMLAGWDCRPARNFVVNEVTSMLPRAWNGWYWYVEKFGRDKVGDRKAAIPWVA